MRKRIKIRKLTNNENILITTLCIIVLLLVGFKYVINPQVLKISSLEAQRNSLKLKNIENNRMVKEKETILHERNELSIEKESIKKDFFRSLDQPHIIYLLNELLLKSDIKINDISFNKPFTETLNNQEVEKMNISMPFEGSFASFNEMIKNLKLGNKKIIINNIKIQKGEHIEIIGSIELGVYSLIDTIEKSNYTNDSFDKQITNKNELNPFIPYKGYIDLDKIKQDNSKDMLSESNEKEMGEDLLKEGECEIYEVIEGDNVSYISMKRYGTERYVDEILELNNMQRFNILPIGKKLKLRKR